MGAERSVARRQTWELGPPSAPAKILAHISGGGTSSKVIQLQSENEQLLNISRWRRISKDWSTKTKNNAAFNFKIALVLIQRTSTKNAPVSF